MPKITSLIVVLFLAFGGYGIHTGVRDLYLAGAVGLVAVIVNLLIDNFVINWVSFFTIFGALIFALYTGATAFF